MNNVTFGECDDFSGRVKFNGDYNQNECGVEISGARLEDAGDWTCQLESYSFGGQRGEQAKVDTSWKLYWLINYFLYCRNHSESPSFRNSSLKGLEMIMMMMMAMMMTYTYLWMMMTIPSHLLLLLLLPLLLLLRLLPLLLLLLLLLLPPPLPLLLLLLQR